MRKRRNYSECHLDLSELELMKVAKIAKYLGFKHAGNVNFTKNYLCV